MNRAELVKKLELAKPALAGNDLVPVYTAFTFQDGRIVAYNDTLAISVKCDVGIKDPFAVNGRNLLELLKASTSEEVDLKLTEEEFQVKAGKARFKLPFFTEEDFIFQTPVEVFKDRAAIMPDLIQGIDICLTTSSRDLTLNAMMGVCFRFEKDLVTLYSTDGDAITRYVVEQGEPEGKGTYTISNEFCGVVSSIFNQEYDKKIVCTLQVNENWAVAGIGPEIVVMGRMMEIPQPLDHEAEIEKTIDGDVKLTPVPLGFSEALARARVIADLESAPTTLTVKKGKLSLETKTSYGHVEDDLVIRGHEDVEATVHASLIQRALGVCDKIVILENCTAYAKDDKIFQVVSNMGE